ncbi:MAG: tRNA lysidine(34) synthetase TilS [Candidatus Zixiibacteriota bacterium]|nr:MAG: tRNA lysidine(34) synthetase TilS [candidate division Zixibacteria bacterium]
MPKEQPRLPPDNKDVGGFFPYIYYICAMRNIVRIVEHNIREQDLIARGEKVLVAFSGGPDSTALLHILHSLTSILKFDLAACHINHKIRRRAAKTEMTYCAEFCRMRDIPFIIVEADIPAYANKEKLSLEEAGRIFRRLALERIAGEENCAKIALGHHLDDQIETILFRLFRGTGPQGIMPIKPISGNLIRPLLNIGRTEIEVYLKKHRLSPVLDESNLRSRYSRNYIRNKIIPAIEEHFRTKYRGAILNFAKIVMEENDFLKDLVCKRLKMISLVTPGGKIVVDLNKMSGYDLWLRRRLIKECIERISRQTGAGSFEDVERVDAVITGRLKAASLSREITVAADRQKLFFMGQKVRFETKELKVTGITEVAEIRSRIKCSFRSPSASVATLQKLGHKVNFDYARMVPPLQIRAIRPGDTFSPLGMKGVKKIGDFLTDRKVSRYIRDEIPVIADQRGIVWLVGHQIADRVKVGEKTKKILEIEFSERRRHGIS